MKHFLVAAGVAWGHVRPLTALCIRLCKLNPDLHITFLLQKFLAPKQRADRVRYDFESVQDRFHIIEGGVDHPEGLVSSQEYRALLFKIGDEAMQEYQKVIKGVKRPDALSGKDVDPWNTEPDAVILDTTLFGAMMAILGAIKDSNPKPRVLSFLPIGLPAVAFNTSEGFVKIVNAVKSSEDKVAAYQKHVVEGGILNQLPGRHPFYQYEIDPNVNTIELYDLWSALDAAKPSFDLSIIAWPTVLGPGRGAPAGSGGPPPGERHAFIVGPQLPDDPTSTQSETSDEEHAGQIVQFLDKWHKQKGDHSVIYISFGSLEFPPTQEHLWQFSDVLDELQVPYIMSQGNTPPAVLAELPGRIAKSGDRGLFAKWAPQVTILKHPATMGFMTHGGSNSAMEALLCGVPMIQWPHAWDQPMIANQMDFLGAAVELLQVRREHNIGRPTGRGVDVVGTPDAIAKEMKDTIAKLQGASGDKMRAAAKGLGDEIRQDMGPGGAAHSEMKALAFLSAKTQ